MARWQHRDFGLVDKQTGEIYDAVISLRRKSIGGKWMKVFQDGKAELLRRSPQLHGQSHRILNHLEAVVGWGNIIPPPVALAGRLGLARESVYRAYAELRKAEFVIKKDGVYYLSPLYCWKGTETQLQGAWQRLLAPASSLAMPARLVEGLALPSGATQG